MVDTVNVELTAVVPDVITPGAEQDTETSGESAKHAKITFDPEVPNTLKETVLDPFAARVTLVADGETEKSETPVRELISARTFTEPSPVTRSYPAPAE